MTNFVLFMFSHRATAAFIITALVSVSAFPIPTFARSTVSCELYQRVDGKDMALKDDAMIVGKEGETIVLTWKSSGATKATDQKRREVDLNGSATLTVRSTSQDVAYTFRNKSERVTCGATIASLSADINERVLRKSKTRPIISGTASGVSSVRIVLAEEGSSTSSYDRTVRVSRGKWKTSSIRGLDAGTYTISVYAAGKNIQGSAAPLLDSVTFRYGKESSRSSSRNTTTGTARSKGSLFVSSIPLLAGGTTSSGQTIPVSYLQVQNSGTEPVTLSSIQLKQTGTLGAANVSALSVFDDQGFERGRTGAGAPFRDAVGSVPVTLTIAPGEMRLLTIKASLSPQAVPGLSLHLVVSDLTTAGTLRASLPLPGATWTITR